MLWVAIFAVSLLLAGASVWRGGGAWERRGFWLIAGTTLAAVGLAWFAPRLPALRLIPELILGGGLIALAWKHDRPWPAWAAGWAAVLICIEAYGVLIGAGSPRAALLAGCGVGLSLAVGALRRPWTP